MKRFAIYARYSSDNQKETSIEDQVRECQRWIEAQSGNVAEIYKDFAVSGAHFNNRPELQKLLNDAGQNKFDCVVAEDLSRFSRDQEHSAGLFKRLEFQGVRMYTLSDNEITTLHIGLKGTINQIFLTDLAEKTRRGQRGAVERGKIPGGISYGYKKLKEYDENGELIPGQREIHEEEAGIIRRIFDEYLCGKSARAIAANLNKEGVPSPRGGQWMASTINGNPARQNGVLCNMLYAGKIVYNRQKFKKNPDTGKRKAILNPPEEWVIKEAENLRIIDQDTWDKVQKMKKAIAGKPKRQQVRNRHMFSGLIKCGECGGAYTVYGNQRYSCSHRRERGTCTNKTTIKITEVQERILRVLEHKLVTPELLEEYAAGFSQGLKEQRSEKIIRLKKAKKELHETDKKIENIVNAIMDGMYSPTMKDTLPLLENRKIELSEEIEQLSHDNVIKINPNMASNYNRGIKRLTRMLKNGGNESLEATKIIRLFVHKIIVSPSDEHGKSLIEFQGDLANILNFAESKDMLMTMVAGVGFGHNQHSNVISLAA